MIIYRAHIGRPEARIIKFINIVFQKNMYLFK